MQVSAAVKLSDADQATIGALKREIEKAWKAVEGGQEKVRRRSGLRAQGLGLWALVESGGGRSGEGAPPLRA